jgi:tRNA nucleotidyltransferase (CCA-adding enzyme)
MALSLASADAGSLIDPQRGAADLADGTLRVLHPRSFIDDPTRVARAVRLTARLGFVVERETRRLMKLSLCSDAQERLSASRRRREVVLLFEEPHWEITARTLTRYDAWSVIDRTLAPSRTVDRRLARMERWVAWYTNLDQTEPPGRWIVALVALTREAGKTTRSALVGRLQPDRRAAEQLLHSSGQGERIVRRLRSTRTLRPSLVRTAGSDACATGWLEALDRTRPGKIRDAIVDYLSRGRLERIEINGRDLSRAGVPLGPRIAAGLEAALAAKLDGEARDAVAQLEVAVRIAGQT